MINTSSYLYFWLEQINYCELWVSERLLPISIEVQYTLRPSLLSCRGRDVLTAVHSIFKFLDFCANSLTCLMSLCIGGTLNTTQPSLMWQEIELLSIILLHWLYVVEPTFFVIVMASSVQYFPLMITHVIWGQYHCHWTQSWVPGISSAMWTDSDRGNNYLCISQPTKSAQVIIQCSKLFLWVTICMYVHSALVNVKTVDCIWCFVFCLLH